MSPLTAVAMSGGLDSSVAAWMLSRERRVVGLSMLLWDELEEEPPKGVHQDAGSGRCCGALDLGDARRVAQQCGIHHYTLRMDEPFRRHVVEPFVRDYLAGRTPVPCTSCNTWIKFDLFLDRARELGAERIATGHYARIVEGQHGPELHRAVDRGKDQSYYLWELSRRQLAASEFPLGELHKSEVRELAREAGLLVAEKGESMELCFVAGGVREFVERQVAASPERFGNPVQGVDGVGGASAPAIAAPALLVDRQGTELGRGEPYYRYTVGQRRGLGIGGGERLYVLGIQADENRVTVGRLEELAADGLRGDGLHWIGEELDPGAGGEVKATVKIRSRHPGVDSVIRPREDGRVEVEFATPQHGVAPGQAAVFYRGERVLGGCWIS
jgi:tRNA-uridine 2-sulfurtransferase